MTVAQYDEIGEEYAKYGPYQTFHKYAVYPRFFGLIGDVQGQWILDLACGDGYIGRELVARGARMVVGIDESRVMLDIATRNNPYPWNTEFHWGRVGSLGPVGSFSRITGGYVLHYSSSKDELSRMISDIKENLLPGGIFFGINTDPLKVERKFGRKLKPGERLEWRVENFKPFFNYFWPREVYDELFRGAGFSIEWIGPTPTEEGLQLHAAEWWTMELAAKPLALLKCVRL